MKRPIMFLRVAWMQFYKGVTKNDIPNGAGSYITENKDGGEVLNFKPINGNFYGFARIKNGHSLNINRLGAKTNDEFIDNVMVVFFATDPILRGQYVVGWYENARLYRKVQNNFPRRNPHSYYMTVSSIENSELLPLRHRKFDIPSDGPGQTNAWYVGEYADHEEYLSEFTKFKRNPETYLKRKSGGGGSGWMLDAEKRKQIEVAAMDATFNYFEERGFKVKYVQNEKLGWDMEAIKGKIDLKLEVKGSCNPLDSILLTPNEYVQSKNHKNYRICILEHALDESKSTLHICQLHPAKKHWASNTGKFLNIREIISAKLQLDI